MTENSQQIIDRIHETTAKKGPAGLPRMRRLLELLSNPESSLRIFHVGGTNGKGSVCGYIQSILEAQGYRVGLYCSPHVMEYNERFMVGSECITDEDFTRIGNRVLSFNEQLAEEGFGYPSEFELLTSIAYVFFEEQRPDYVVLEVGLGGIIDSTNTIEAPLVSVITQIGKDHTQFLGTSLAEIAGNKAGIIKPRVPVISQSSEQEVKDVIAKEADAKGALFIDSSDMPYTVHRTGFSWAFDAEILGKMYPNLTIEMPGEHQVQNAITAASAVLLAAERSTLTISEDSIRQGLQDARVMGRFEVLQKNPTVIIDGGHNPNGVRSAMNTLKCIMHNFPKESRVLIVTGCFRDKDYRELVSELTANDWNVSYIATEPKSERALPATELAALLREQGFYCESIAEEEEAYSAAVRIGADVTLFVGSIYLIGDVRIFYQQKGWNSNV